MEKKLEMKRLAGVRGEGQGGAILGRIMDKGVKVCRKARMDLCCCCCSCWRKVQFPLLLHTSTKKPPLVQNSKNLHTNKCTGKMNYVLLLYKSRSFTGLKMWIFVHLHLFWRVWSCEPKPSHQIHFLLKKYTYICAWFVPMSAMDIDMEILDRFICCYFSDFGRDANSQINSKLMSKQASQIKFESWGSH